MKKAFLLSMLNILALCIVVFTISSYFIFHTQWIGLVTTALGLLCLASLVPFKVQMKNVWPDIVFGIIDNGLLAVLAIFGGEIGGVGGAIIGGVVGNSITDGIAGIFEGWSAERLTSRKVNDHRTMLGSAVGKMSGCLLGAGIVLIFAQVANQIF